MAILFGLHVLAAVIWVGGIFFAYMALRPAAAELLEPPLRLPLWRRTFQHFFVWVWVMIVTLLLTGYAMIFGFLGGMEHLALPIHLMQGLGMLMILLFMLLYFGPYPRLAKAVDARDFENAARHLASMRKIIATNLSLGLAVVAVAAFGRHWS